MAISNHKEAVEQASALLQATAKGLASILEHEELQGIKRRIISQLYKANNTICGAAGIFTPNANLQEVNDIIKTFQPLESVGGEPLARIMPVDTAALDIQQEERENFLSKRDDLYDRFLTLGSNQIFSLMKEPAGVLLIRSVAKRAGLVDYRDRTIDTEFVDDVKKLIEGQGEVNQAAEKAQGTAAIDTEDPDDEDLDDDTDDQDDQDAPEPDGNVRKGAPNYSHLGKGAAKRAPVTKKGGGK